jgi:uncharacterized protein
MHIYLPEIRAKSGHAIDYVFEENLSGCYDDFTEGGKFRLIISAALSGDKVIISGNLDISASAICSRCLEPFEYHYSYDINEAFTVLKVPSGEKAAQMLAAETANLLTVTGDYLYLDEYIRQIIILAQDYRMLCNPDCKGICAGCGTDLNKSSCLCSKDNHLVDARLLKLKEINPGDLA